MKLSTKRKKKKKSQTAGYWDAIREPTEYKRYYLLIWDHYRVNSMFFLIPEKRVNPRVHKLLRKANGNFINSERGHIPESTHKLRQSMSDWLKRYEVKASRLSEEPIPVIVEVCYTGQLG